MIPLGPWTPDQPIIYGPHLRTAQGIVPNANGYGPFKPLTASTAALAARPIGAASFRDPEATSHLYAGTETKLYELANDGTWTDVTRLSGGDYAATENDRFRFTQFGDYCIATNFTDAIQYIQMTSGSNFAALAGSPPQARHIATFGDFVFLGYTSNSAYEVKWSGINDPEQWSSGTDQSGAQTLPDGGIVQGFAVTDTLTVFQQSKIWRVQYVGPPIIMQFDLISRDKGCLGAGTIAQLGSGVFFLAGDGFYQLQGDSLVPIGADKVDEWFFADVNSTYYERITAAADPQSKVVYWSYPSTQSVNGIPDTVLMYHWTAQKWSYARTTAEIVINAYGLGYTLEGLDTITTNIDTFTTSLDDPSLIGGNLQVQGFSGSYTFGPFSGSNAAAEIETGDFEFNQNRRAYVHSVEPVMDNDNATIRVSGRERLGDTVTFSDQATQESNGMCSVDSPGRYHRIKIETTSGDTWTSAVAIDVGFEDDGEI